MKKISKWYYILMVLFIISAVSDFYSYSLFMNGKSSIIYIQGASMVQSAVDMHLILAIVKLVLAGLAILVGWRETKNKKRSRSMTAVTVALTVSIIGIWIISMNYLTTVTAQGISNALYDKGLGYASDVGQSASLREFCEGSEKQPDQLEHRMLQAIDEHTFSTYLSTGQKNWEKAHFRIRDTAYPVERAVLFYDGSGKLLHSSGEDVMYFPYYTQDQWEAGIRRTSRPSYSWIDISGGKNSENGQEDMYSRFRNGFAGTGEMGIAALRITGYFEGTQLVPVVMDYLTDSAAKHMAVGSGLAGPTGIIDAHILCSLDKSNSLEWQPQFDRAGEYKAKDLVTVYAYYPDMWDYAGESLTYGGQYYEDLVSLTERLDLPLKNSDTCRKSSIGGTKELTVFSMEAYKQAESETADFYLVTAIRGKPLAYAAEELLHVYVYTGLLALGFLLAARYGIKKHLVQPIAEISAAMEDNWRKAEQSEYGWREVRQLQAGYCAERDRRRGKDDEITRLNTVLRFAKTAEDNRRRMVSNIAHELKTPLAVIHSYAEGLKEHIAEDKRDKYADVILTEAERADAMVLEMLELSRLEAGKVKLSREEFSLEELTRAIFGRLDMAIKAKDLQVNYVFPENTTVTADESRIWQVVENFATNAVKYTPAGGSITVRIQKSRSQTTFAIENDSAPLSSEELAKVWDTFYRTDESRSTGGTGLGLAIAKSIVELHGGKCSVKNTKIGVEFDFSI